MPVWRMLKAGFLNACSVGFQPSEWDESATGIDFKSQSLLEHSVVPIPAHASALVMARSKGINVAPLRDFYARVLDGSKRKGDAARALRKDIELWKIQADPAGRKLFAILPQLKMDAPAPDHREEFEAMGAMLVQAGTALNTAAVALNELLGVPRDASIARLPHAGNTPAPDAGNDAPLEPDETVEQEHLRTVIDQSGIAVTAATNVGAMATSLVGGAPAAPAEPELPKSVAYAPLARMLDDLSSISRVPAIHRAALNRATQEVRRLLKAFDHEEEIFVDGRAARGRCRRGSRPLHD